MKIKRIGEYVSAINEAHKPQVVEQKDWDRMMDLYNRIRHGDVDVERIAKKIGDVNKALARAVAGLKILMAAEQWRTKNDTLSPDELKTYLKFSDLYDFTHSMWEIGVEDKSPHQQTISTLWHKLCTAFLSKAAELGADEKSFYALSDAAQMPANLLDKETNTRDILGTTGYGFKKIEQQYNVVIEYGYTKKDGSRYWSGETEHSHKHNGKCWPISFEYTIYDSTKTNIISTGNFVQVTNEGGGNYGWDFDGYRVHGFKDVLDKMIQKAGLK